MSTDKAVVILVVSVVGTLFCAWQVRRALREPLDRDRVVADVILHTDPPEVDTEPGTNVAVQDECELIWSMPVYEAPDVAMGYDRFRAAIRDEQQKGEAS